MKKFIVHWRDGSKKQIEGNDVLDAFTRAGYGDGAKQAVDYWERVEEPESEAVAEMTEKARMRSLRVDLEQALEETVKTQKTVDAALYKCATVDRDYSAEYSVLVALSRNLAMTKCLLTDAYNFYAASTNGDGKQHGQS